MTVIGTTMLKTICWSVATTVIAVGFIYCIAWSNNEEAKQRAFMMKACVDAGGQWERDGWTAYFNCRRPK